MTDDSAAPSTNRLRLLLASDIPTVAVSYSDATTDDEIQRAVSSGVDVAELRIDRNARHAADVVAADAGRFAALPTIATIRCAAEGGEWTGPDPDRAVLYRALLPHVDGIDIELASVEASTDLAAVVAEAAGKDRVVILSHHDFEATPPAALLDDIAARARGAGADVVKVAAMATGPADVATLAAFTLRTSGIGRIVIAMGDHGTQSRVFFPTLGSQLTFAHGGANVVPGQLDFAETASLLRRFSPEYRASHQSL